MTGTIVSVVKVKSETEVEAVDISSRLGDTENVRFSSMAQTKNKSEESVQVVVRCRPLNEKEIEQGWISADLLIKHSGTCVECNSDICLYYLHTNRHNLLI